MELSLEAFEGRRKTEAKFLSEEVHSTRDLFKTKLDFKH